MKEREIESAREATYRNERFNRGMRSLDWSLEKGDISKFAWLGDGGASAERMYAALDGCAAESAANKGWRIVRERRRKARLEQALALLNAQSKHALAQTLALIYKNGNDRNRSIRALVLARKARKKSVNPKQKFKYFIFKSEWKIAKAHYFRNRRELMDQFL